MKPAEFFALTWPQYYALSAGLIRHRKERADRG